MASRSILEFFKPTEDSGDDRRLKSVPASVADLVEKEIRKTSENLQRTATDASMQLERIEAITLLSLQKARQRSLSMVLKMASLHRLDSLSESRRIHQSYGEV